MAYFGKDDRGVVPFRDDSPAGKFKRLALLIGSFILIWVLMTHIAPWGEKTAPIRPLMEFIEERNIDAGALYYTEIEEFAEADIQMNHSLDYPPRGP
jgi:hypothetical protein